MVTKEEALRLLDQEPEEEQLDDEPEIFIKPSTERVKDDRFSTYWRDATLVKFFEEPGFEGQRQRFADRLRKYGHNLPVEAPQKPQDQSSTVEEYKHPGKKKKSPYINRGRK